MKRSIILAVIIALTVGIQTARAASILYYPDYTRGIDYMAMALTALSATDTVTVATSPTDFATKLASGSYDMAIFFQQEGQGPDYDAAFAALSTFIAGGGLAIADDWTRNIAPGAVFDTTFTGGFNETSLIITDVALLAGFTSPQVSLGNPGWGFFSLDLAVADPAATCSASFPTGCAIVSGNGGHTFFNGFLSDTFNESGLPGEQLYENEINTLFAQVCGEEARDLGMNGEAGADAGAVHPRRCGHGRAGR
jgi:hypothetical protein